MLDSPSISQRTRFLFASVGMLACLAGALCAEMALGRMRAGRQLARYHLASMLFLTQPETTRRSVAVPPPDIAEVQRRLDNIGAQSGDVQVSLAWNNYNDLDLSCLDPYGELIDGYNQSSRSGGVLDVDMNVTDTRLVTPQAVAKLASREEHARQHRTAYSSIPVENLVWAHNAPVGHYKVFVHQFCNKELVDQTPFWVVVRVHGEVHRISGVMGRDDFCEQLVDPKLVYEFDVRPAKPGAAAAFKPTAAAPPPPPRIVTQMGFTLNHIEFALLVAGVWGALVGLLAIALLAAQRIYLRQPPVQGAQDLIVAACGPAAGLGAAVAAQLALALLGSALPPSAFTVLCLLAWTGFGGLFGCAISLITPNVSRIGGLAAGAVSGLVGSWIFLQLASSHMDGPGRLLCASLIGGAIGALIALPERERLPDPEPDDAPRASPPVSPPFVVHGTRTRKVGGLRQTGPRD